MKAILDRWVDRMLTRLGLGLDFSIDLSRDPFSRIRPTLYLGARPRPEQLASLKELGITHVVSCLEEDERARMAFLKQDFHHLFLPIRDGIHQDIASTFPTFFDFALDAQNPPSKLYIHCEVGVSRSATLVTALLMNSEHKRFLEAFHEVRSKRVEILPNIGFASQLQRFEHDMHPEKRADGEYSSLARYLHQICNAPVEIDVLQTMLKKHGYDALKALHAIFGEDIPRVLQGVRL